MTTCVRELEKAIKACVADADELAAFRGLWEGGATIQELADRHGADSCRVLGLVKKIRRLDKAEGRKVLPFPGVSREAPPSSEPAVPLTTPAAPAIKRGRPSQTVEDVLGGAEGVVTFTQMYLNGSSLRDIGGYFKKTPQWAGGIRKRLGLPARFRSRSRSRSRALPRQTVTPPRGSGGATAEQMVGGAESVVAFCKLHEVGVPLRVLGKYFGRSGHWASKVRDKLGLAPKLPSRRNRGKTVEELVSQFDASVRARSAT